MTGGVLAFDPSKTCWGWAYASPSAVSAWPKINIGRNLGPVDGVEYGSETFGGLQHDVFIERATIWLRDLCSRLQPGQIAYEDPLWGGYGDIADSIARTRVMFSCEALILQRARIIGATNSSAQPDVIKKWFTGYGMAKKEQMVERAQERGWAPDNHNVADALAVLDYHIGSADGRARKAKVEAAIAKVNPKQRTRPRRKHWRRH